MPLEWAITNVQLVLAGVSSCAQQPDLKRDKLLALLEHLLSGDTCMVVVAHQDQLKKYARRQVITNEVDLFRGLCEQNRGELVVLPKTNLSPKRKTIKDIFAILYGFSSGLSGLVK